MKRALVRLEDLVCSDASRSIDELRVALEADTPDCERPVVWTNAADRWPSERVAVPPRPDER